MSVSWTLPAPRNFGWSMRSTADCASGERSVRDGRKELTIGHTPLEFAVDQIVTVHRWDRGGIGFHLTPPAFPSTTTAVAARASSWVEVTTRPPHPSNAAALEHGSRLREGSASSCLCAFRST